MFIVHTVEALYSIVVKWNFTNMYIGLLGSKILLVVPLE